MIDTTADAAASNSSVRRLAILANQPRGRMIKDRMAAKTSDQTIRMPRISPADAWSSNFQ
ncbi:MAG: hypothetical protein J2P23_05495 [Microlunatus sp.]|nr:hypothetical protein [Microlunatus sp.]